MTREERIVSARESEHSVGRALENCEFSERMLVYFPQLDLLISRCP